jgi:GNAT superfamily N-acetyltransferase
MFTWSDAFTWNEQDVVNNVARFPEDRPMLRLVVEDAGEVVAYGRVCEVAPNPRGAFQGEAIVFPEHHRRGIGREIVARLEAYAREKGARCLLFLVPERHSGSIAAAERCGYSRRTHYYQSVIDPQSFDAGRFVGATERARESGFVLTSLAELPQGDELDRAYYDAVHASDLDTPFMDYFGWPDFDDYKRMAMNVQWFDRAGVFVALKDGVIVGVSTVNKGSGEFNGEMFVEYTGVLREHRGKGLATALKVLAVGHAKSIGGTMLRTENNDANPAMRAVNTRLGFVESPGMWMVVKEL